MGHVACYSSSFVKSKGSCDTTRKAAWIAQSLAQTPIPGLEVTEPLPLPLKDAAKVHSTTYLDALETGTPTELALSPELAWDQDTLARALSTCGGMVGAGERALKLGVAGCLASGFHHAKRDRGQGFCTLNGLAIAARVLAEQTRKHVLILDLDAHCGGGTHGLIKDHPLLWQIDVSVDRYDEYNPGDRCQFKVVREARQYLRSTWSCLQQAEAEWPLFSLCLYNAGMDVHQDCQIGGLEGMDEFILTLREEMVFQWCKERGTPIAYTMAGGYTGGKMSRRKLVDLHRLTLATANASA
jgi:acetoin utilization deacetylase AcuC-like enzyme